MNNRFINFLEFVTDDAEAQAKNLYHPIKKLRKWEAQEGDFWRLLVKNSILRGHDLPKIQARIILCPEVCGVWDGETFEDTGKRAVLRKQYCENYSEFIIKLNEVSTQSNYRQFALTRANGQRVLGTVRETATDLESYAAKVQAHFESYPFTSVIVHRKGAVLAVRVYTNERFYMDDEEVVIGIGQVPESNINTPTLSSVFMETVSYAAQFSFQLNIKNVEPGNRFELNGVSYEAQKGDDVATVKTALLGGASRLIVPQTQVNSVLVSTGTRTVVNSNTPRIDLAYFDTDGGDDRYLVTIGASIVAGNTYQIQATGQPTKTHTAIEGDTVASIKAALTEVSGYYEVPTGTVIADWLVLAGTQRIPNVNEPSMTLSDQQVIAAVDKDKYRIIVGNDVAKGNEYTLNGVVYVAKSDDTAESVGIALGLSGSVGTIEIEEDETLACYAKVGKKYTEEDVADVSIIQHPRIFRSNQLVMEVNWVDLLAENTYCIQLYDLDSEEVLGYSNLIRLTEQAEETSLLEVADSYEAHGYEYFERLTQIIRIPIFLRTPKQRIQENRTPLLNGGFRRAATVIETMQEMITRAEAVEFHQVLAAWLKHSKVWVDGEAYYAEGEYAEMIVSESSQIIQGKTMLVLSGERNNKTTYFTTNSKPMRCGGGLLYGFVYGLRLVLKTGSFEYELQEGHNIVPAADYELFIYNDGDARNIRIALEGYETERVIVSGQSKARKRRLVRVESSKTLEIYCEKVAVPSVIYTPEYASEAFVVEEYTCEKTIATTADFGDDFGDDFNTGTD